MAKIRELYGKIKKDLYGKKRGICMKKLRGICVAKILAINSTFTLGLSNFSILLQKVPVPLTNI